MQGTCAEQFPVLNMRSVAFALGIRICLCICVCEVERVEMNGKP